MKSKKIISILLTIAILMGFLPQSVLASTTVNIDVSTVSTDGTGYTCSAITVNGKTEYEVTITDNGTYELTGISDHPNDATHPTHVVVSAESANIILNGVHISLYNFSPLAINPGSTVNLTVAEGTTNTLTTASSSVAFAGIFVPPYATVIVDGTGTLNAGGSFDGGAGIGGGKANGNANVGIITINSGIINASGGWYAAGIGGGDTEYASVDQRSGGTITINGGVINAIGGYQSAGIGGGFVGDSGSIYINGGTVTSTAGSHAAGIGGGSNGSGDVTISGGTVTAYGCEGGAGIGGGVGCLGRVTISGGTITANANSNGNGYGAGIGSGYLGGYLEWMNSTITISGGVINASSKYGAGIGGGKNENGQHGGGADVIISGGVVNATSTNGAGIGRGNGCYEISSNTIIGGSIKGSSFDPAPTNGTNITYLATVTVIDSNSQLLANTSIPCTIPGGVTFDTITDSEGKLYLWLPESNNTTVTLTSGGINYKASGSITSGINNLTATILTVGGVTVTPPSAEVQKGMTHIFSAVVEGINNPDQTVIWSVTGGVAGTNIDSNGVLTVAINESASTLIIAAISTTDITKSGSTTVTVKPKQITVIPDAGQTKAYGTISNSDITYTVTPALQNGESLSGTLSRTAGESVGNYEITQGSLNGGSDYDITFVTGVDFTISKSTLAILFRTVQNSGTVYGENNVTLEVEMEKVENGDIPSGSVIFKRNDMVIGSSVLNENGEGSITATIGAGDHKFTAEYSGNDNYNENSETIENFNVAKAMQNTLSIDGGDQLKNVGDTAFTLGTSGGSGSGAISWVSSNTNVATIDNIGEVTVVGAGEATITVTKYSDDNYNETTASVSITVVDKTVLHLLIDIANIMKNSAVTGNEQGQYPQEAFEAFTSVIENAVSVSNNDSARQDVVNQAKTDLESAITEFLTKQISEDDTPTESPTVAPTETPTVAPTESPTVAPTETPTVAPTESPTVAPTESPTVAPTESPTVAPTESPTVAPTESPTVSPTVNPTVAPTGTQTVAPNGTSASTPTVAPTGTSTVTTKVTVKKPSITATAGSRKVVLKWKKVKSVSGYEIKMAKSMKGKYATIKKVNSKTVKYTKKSLIKGKKYYFKVRAYKVVSGKKVYSKYSAIKSIKIK